MTADTIPGMLMFGTPITANYTVRRSNKAVYRPHNDPYYHHTRRKPKRRRPRRKH